MISSELTSAPAPAMGTPLSVSALNAMTRALLESNLSMLWISGEVSNFIRAASGHCYFVLKDANAQVRCTLFRHRLQYLDVMPSNGDQVEVRALPSLYEARGEFQLNIDYLRRGGIGRLFEAFEQLKKKLEARGLFTPAHKRPMPLFARKIGLVTSPSGAALRDVLATLRRRMSGMEIILYPTLVQGAGAAENIARAMGLASSRGECDVLILCRGGGSIEDLWAFNEEVVAHAIYDCAVPVVSGVGHETDFTIADFVADLRAPTPTAAAELVSPNRADWLRRVHGLSGHLQRHMGKQLEDRMQRIDFLGRRLVHPGERLRLQTHGLMSLRDRLRRAWAREMDRTHWGLSSALRRWSAASPDLRHATLNVVRIATEMSSASVKRVEALKARLDILEGKLDSLSPRSVLQRGYSIIWDESGRAVQSSDQLGIGSAVSLQFARGQATATVTSKS